MKTGKKRINSASPAPAPAAEEDIFRHKAAGWSGRLFELAARLPRALHIGKADAIDMYQRIEAGASYRSVSYWAFIIASCGIATIGLITNSPAVIIGAMLVSPLMAPITGLGLSTAISDVYLGVKSIYTLLLSMAASVAASAIMTAISPLQEATAEVLARTNPSLMDLFIALFCGLVAAWSSVRARGEDALQSVAPGAAIGVALMPPLCVVGFGLGSGQSLEFVWGAFLLFTTNLIGIVLISSAFYYLVFREYQPERLVRLAAARREKEEALYTNARFSPLWNVVRSGPRSRRFWYPLALLLLISYPLASSLAFLKQKTDVRNAILSELANVSGVELLRGPDALKYSRDRVSGSIIYSGGDVNVQDADLEERIRARLKARFPNLKSEVQLLRIAGERELRDLVDQGGEVSLERRTGALQDGVREAGARALATRAAELITARFPEQIGVAVDARLTFSPDGMHSVEGRYYGATLAPETRGALQSVLRNALRESGASLEQVTLTRVGPARVRASCGASGDVAPSLAALREAVHLTRLNSRLQLNVVVSPQVLAAWENRPAADFPRVKIELRTGGCQAEYEFSRT